MNFPFLDPEGPKGSRWPRRLRFGVNAPPRFLICPVPDMLLRMTCQFAVREVIDDPRRRDHFVGVEVGPAIIRAGVFSESFRLVGKTKFSTKLERGPMSVIERVPRCIHYAAAERDLPLYRIQSVGVV